MNGKRAMATVVYLLAAAFRMVFLTLPTIDE